MAIQFYGSAHTNPGASTDRVMFVVLDSDGLGVTGLTHASFSVMNYVSKTAGVTSSATTVGTLTTGSAPTEALSAGKILEVGNGLYTCDSPVPTADVFWLEGTTASGTVFSQIRTISRGPDVDTDGAAEADVTKLNTDATAAAKLALSALGIITGTAVTGTLNTTTMTTDLTGFADDELIGATVVFTGGTAAGQRSTITDYAATNGTITFDAITTAPVNNDPFVVV